MDFAGTDPILLADVSDEDGRHQLRILSYLFHDGSRSIYIEVEETHEGFAGKNLYPLSGAVHILRNVTEAERWALEMREHS